MEIPFISRPFYPDELRILKTIRTKTEKEMKEKPPYWLFLTSSLVCVVFFYFASIVKIGFFEFFFVMIGFVGGCIFLSGPFTIYKEKKRRKEFLKNLADFIQVGTVATRTIHAKRIAFGPEYEDESDIYIIEYDTDRVLYLWDLEYNLRKKFPCLHFEIYEEKFSKLLGRQIYPLSEKIEPIRIDKKAKWKYMGRFKENLQVETINFDKLLEDIMNSLKTSS